MLLPLADGSLNQGDRQHVPFMYRGILAAAPVVVVVVQSVKLYRAGRAWLCFP